MLQMFFGASCRNTKKDFSYTVEKNCFDLLGGYVRVLWLHLDTTGLNTEYTNVLDLAYWPEVASGVPCPKGPRHFRVQPLLHAEDQRWNAYPLLHVVQRYNRGLNPESPEFLLPCSLKEGADPIFAYERGSLTFRVEPPKVLNPSEWLLDRSRLSSQVVLSLMQDDLAQIEQQDAHHRWTIASYNASFTTSAFLGWCRRVLGVADSFQNDFNRYYALDGLSLVRWAQYQGSLKIREASLKSVAPALGIAYTYIPEESSLSELLAAQKVASALLSGKPHEHYQKPRVVSSQVPSKDFA